jgi:hypothetical protein
MEAAVLEISEAVEIPEALVQEVVEATEPAVPRADPAKERSRVVAMVATLVFLKVIQLAIEHPTTAEEILTACTIAWYSASVAAGQAGKLWDKFFAASSTDPEADPGSEE